MVRGKAGERVGVEDGKIFQEILHFPLQNRDGHGIIIERDCTKRFF